MYKHNGLLHVDSILWVCLLVTVVLVESLGFSIIKAYCHLQVVLLLPFLFDALKKKPCSCLISLTRTSRIEVHSLISNSAIQSGKSCMSCWGHLASHWAECRAETTPWVWSQPMGPPPTVLPLLRSSLLTELSSYISLARCSLSGSLCIQPLSALLLAHCAALWLGLPFCSHTCCLLHLSWVKPLGCLTPWKALWVKLCLLQRRHVEGLTPNPAEWELIWKWVFYNNNQVNMESLGWTLVQYDWCKREELGHRDAHMKNVKECWHTTGSKERNLGWVLSHSPQKKRTDLLTPWFQTSCFQNHETTCIYCSSYLFC
jgi:hypothetical protein